MNGRRRRTRARGDPGAGFVLRRARHPFVRRRQGPRGGPRRRRSSCRWPTCATKPLVNMESAVNHPCQALADWKTMDDLAVPRSRQVRAELGLLTRARCRSPCRPPTVHMAAQRGMDVVVLRPEGYALPDAIMDKARAAAAASGGIVTETTRSRSRRCAGAHVVYAKEWGSPLHYGDAEAEARARAAARRLVRARKLVPARAARLSFHALPAGAPQRRGRRRNSRRTAQPRDPRSRQPHGRPDGRAVSIAARGTDDDRTQGSNRLSRCARCAARRRTSTCTRARSSSSRPGGGAFRDADDDARLRRAGRDPASPRHPRRAGARRRPAARRSDGEARRARRAWCRAVA